MSEPASQSSIPARVMLAAALLLGFALLATGAARVSGVGKMANLQSTPVERLDLHFEDREDGAVVVRAAGTGQVVEVLEPGTNGFIRSVLRGLARERRLRDLGPEPPFHLTRWADGRLSLDDPSTGRRVELDAFGPTNSAAFAQLLRDPTTQE